MKFKLDENLGSRGADLLRGAGHDVATVPDHGLCAAPDPALIARCRTESRCLVTLDLDFGNPLLFKPSDYSGIAVLRLPSKSTPQHLHDAVSTLIAPSQPAMSPGSFGSSSWGECASTSRRTRTKKNESRQKMPLN